MKKMMIMMKIVEMMMTFRKTTMHIKGSCTCREILYKANWNFSDGGQVKTADSMYNYLVNLGLLNSNLLTISKYNTTFCDSLASTLEINEVVPLFHEHKI